MEVVEKDLCPVTCPNCGHENEFSYNLLEHNRDLICSSCKKHFFWHVCRNCETGYARKEKQFSCPDCLGKKDLSFGEDREKSCCPWCRSRVNPIKLVLIKKTVGQCRSCKKFYTLENVSFSMCCSLSSFIIGAFGAKSLFSRYESMVVKLLVLTAISFISAYIFNQTIHIKRYRG